MGWCPHCNHSYDEDNESQPCCWSCGHPITCGGDCPDHPLDDRSWLGEEQDFESDPDQSSASSSYSARSGDPYGAYGYEYYDEEEEDDWRYTSAPVKNKAFWEARKSDLATAIHENSLEDVRRIIGLGVYPTVKIGPQENCPLLLAADRGTTQIAEYLLSKQASPNQSNRDGYTPIWMAAMGGHEEMCNLLVSAGADVNVRYRGRTLVEELGIRGNTTLLKFMFSHNAILDSRGLTLMLREAISRDMLPVIDILASATKVELGASDRFAMLCEVLAVPTCSRIMPHISPRFTSPSAVNRVGQTALMCCIDDPVRCQRAVESGVPIDKLDANGNSAMSFAAQSGKIEVVRFLLDAGASPDAAGPDAPSPYQIALSKGHNSIASLLKSRGAKRTLLFHRATGSIEPASVSKPRAVPQAVWDWYRGQQRVLGEASAFLADPIGCVNEMAGKSAAMGCLLNLMLPYMYVKALFVYCALTLWLYVAMPVGVIALLCWLIYMAMSGAK